MSGRRALVTGSSGFIGFHLSRGLAERGWQVVGVDIHDLPGQPDRLEFEFQQADFRDADHMSRLLDGVDVVFHLASAHLQISMPDEEYWDINSNSLTKLLTTAENTGVSKFVHVSSVGVYGQLRECPADEHTPCQPQSIYGKTKLAGEQRVCQYASDSKMPIVVLRPSWVFGVGCPRTAKLYRALHRGRFAIIGRCRNWRHPLFIDDFVQASVQAAEADVPPGEVFVIAGPEAVTSRQLVDTFCETLDLAQPRIRMPYCCGKGIAIALEAMFGLMGKEPPMSRRTLEFFDTDNAFDSCKAEQMLDYKPAYSLARGLAATRVWLEDSLSRSADSKSVGAG